MEGGRANQSKFRYCTSGDRSESQLRGGREKRAFIGENKKRLGKTSTGHLLQDVEKGINYFWGEE